jgi:hypothetical protein
MKRVWSFLVNTFLSVTAKSRRKMLLILLDHMSNLKAKAGNDQEIADMYNRTLPVHDAYNEKYTRWVSAKGAYEGETERMTDELDTYVLWLRETDVKVQNVFLEKTPDYKAIFTGGKSAFYNGPYDQRINQLAVLANRLGNYPQFGQLKADAEAKYTQSLDIRSMQQQKESLYRQASADLEQQRIVAGKMLYANLGLLINKHIDDLDYIKTYYNLKLLRRTSKGSETQEIYTLNILRGTTATADFAFTSDAKFLFFNCGDVPLTIYLAAKPGLPVPPQAINIAVDEEIEIKASELGTADCHLLMVMNANQDMQGMLEISLI